MCSYLLELDLLSVEALEAIVLDYISSEKRTEVERIVAGSIFNKIESLLGEGD